MMPPRSSDDDEAINLLSLDGGGVRGVSSLVILDEIMTKIKDQNGLAEVPKPCEFFHMIAGTSTGVLVAIMLGRLRMSTKEAIEAYDTCAAKIFSSQNRKTWRLSERFKASALQHVVESIVQQRGMGEKIRDPEMPDKGKTLVCVMPCNKIGQPRFLRSFYGDANADGRWDSDVKIWEAARATTAAPSFFKPQKLSSGVAAQMYMDAAIGINNPVEYLLQEPVEEFGTSRRLGCIVSIGTGTRNVELSGLRSWIQAPRFYYHLGKTLKSTATDSEETHRLFEYRQLPFPGSYYRFNVPEAAERFRLHQYREIPALKGLTAKYLAKQEVSQQVCQVAEGLRDDSFDHGLTLGLTANRDRESLFLANTKARTGRPTNPFFTGRKEILQKLDFVFSARDTEGTSRREFVLYGMGGVGKTEIALKASETLEKRFKYIFYIDGSTPVTVAQSYANIARDQGLEGMRTEELRRKAMRWMESLVDEWLLIFDDCNLSDRGSQLPGRGKGNIIYTSRSIDLSLGLPVYCVCEVPPFDRADAVDLLLRASGLHSATENPTDRELREDIVQELGCLPLAVEQAAMAIRAGDWTLDAYLKKIREEKVRILSDPRFRDEDVENPAAFAALELSYGAIQAQITGEGRNGIGRASRAALKVLSLLSFYHPSDFSIRTMVQAARHSHQVGAERNFPLNLLMDPCDYDLDRLLWIDEDGNWDPYFWMGLTVLKRHSLVKVNLNKKTISMHVMVQTWARQRLGKEAIPRWASLAWIVLVESIDFDDGWLSKNYIRKLRPHFDVCLAANPPTEPIYDQYRAHLLHKFGLYHTVFKQFEEAGACFQTAISIFKMELGDTTYPIFALESLAQMEHERGNLAEAELVWLELIERLRLRLKTRMDMDMKALGADQEVPPPTSRLSLALKQHLAKIPILEKLRRHLPDNIPPSTAGLLPRRLSKGKGLRGNLKPNNTDVSDSNDTEDNYADGFPDSDTIDAWIDAAHGELSLVYMDQGRYGMGRRMLLQVAKYMEEQCEEYHPNRMRYKILAAIETDADNVEFWNELCVSVNRASRPEADDFRVSDTALDLYIAVAYAPVVRSVDK